MSYATSISPRSLYIHWPFCPYKCHFCPFVAYAGHDSLMEQYHEALKHEIMLFAHNQSRLELDTIYFGGGTPSTYPTTLLADMLALLKKEFCIQEDGEVSFEVNPGTVDKQKLAVWRSLGITRLSIGVQGLKDTVLQGLNRKQLREDVIYLMDTVGTFFTNVSVDVILGLPDTSPDEWKMLLKTVVTWPIQHISMYLLEIHEGTALSLRVKQKGIQLPDDDGLADLYTWSVQFFADHGFEQYEVSSFAKPGYESRHNTVYWDHKPYKGFGIGACSFDGRSRFQNGADLKAYITAYQEGKEYEVVEEVLTPQQIMNEKIMLGIRRPMGFSLAEADKCMTSLHSREMQEVVKRLQDGGLIIVQNGAIMLTSRGLLVENSIATQLAF